MVSRATCPHGVPKPLTVFDVDDASLLPLCVQHYRIDVADCNSCPECLSARIKNLRRACDILARAQRPEHRNARVEGLSLYFDDLAEWL